MNRSKKRTYLVSKAGVDGDELEARSLELVDGIRSQVKGGCHSDE